MKPLYPHFHYVVYNGRPLSDFSLYISGHGTFNSAERDVKKVEVPGKSGDLIFDNGRFKNVTVTYKDAFILEDDDDPVSFARKMRELASFIKSSPGYHRLEDTYHPDEYRLASCVSTIDPEVYYLVAGQFDLEFDCKPQRFMKSGEKPLTYTSNGKIFNPSSFNSKPIIRVYGYGTLAVGEETITINQHSQQYIDIDCDMMNCYCGVVNCNRYVSLNSDEFPVLAPGPNGVNFSGNISRVIITPRWWFI